MRNSVDLNAFKTADTVLIAFPVYGGAPPIPVRRFAYKVREYTLDKEFIIIATQYMFSGDGAASLGRTIKKWGGKVNYAEHFNMPNNISDCKFFKIKNGAVLCNCEERSDSRISYIKKANLQK